MKIFLGVSEIAGFFSRLKIGFEQLNHQVNFFDFNQHPFDYGGANNPEPLQKIIDSEHNKRAKLSAKIYQLKSIRRILLWPLLLIYALQYAGQTIFNLARVLVFFRHTNAAIFIFGNTLHLNTRLVHFNDLFWLKLIRVKIIFLLVGSDSRPAFLDGAILTGINDKNPDHILTFAAQTQKNNQSMEHYADFIVSNVFSSYFLTKPIIALQAIGNPAMPINGDTEPTPAQVDANTGSIKILHAPSVKDVKGTREIEHMVQILIDEGYPIQFKILSGVSNATVIEELKQCDFVIDQLYSDYPMAGFATEAACYKKPAIVGSYIPYEDYSSASSSLGVPPTVLCHPAALKETIIQLINDKALREKKGQEAYEYVKNVIHPSKVAQRYIDLISNDFPESWWVDPQQYIRAVPMGMTVNRMKQVLESLQDQPIDDQNLQRLIDQGLVFDS